MPYPAGMSAPAAGLTALAEAVLPVVYQHRLVATSQLKTLLQPDASSAVYLRRQLARLRRMGLAAATVRRRGGQGELLWYLTPLGTEVVEAGGEVAARAYRISPQAAASQLQEHTLAVVDTGIAFVEWARRLGHECGPLDWHPEIAHRIRDGESRLGDEAVLVPDAVLSYIHHDHTCGERRLLTWFVEVDRATMPVHRLAAKVHAYARYRSYVPAPPSAGRGRPRTGNGGAGREEWRGHYPSFPRLLFVLTGATEPRLVRRQEDLRALADADVRLQRTGLAAGVTTLDQLQAHGPLTDIVTPLFGPDESTDALLHSKVVAA